MSDICFWNFVEMPLPYVRGFHVINFRNLKLKFVYEECRLISDVVGNY